MTFHAPWIEFNLDLNELDSNTLIGIGIELK